MKSKLFLFLVCCGFSFYGHGQICTGDFDFIDQQSIDDFLVNNPECTSIDGNVTVGLADYPTDIYNVDGLQNITLITGNLHIYAFGQDEMNFYGLAGLTGIEGELLITNFLSVSDSYGFLTGLNGFDALNSVGSLILTLTGNIDISSLYSINSASSITINGINGQYYEYYDLFPDIVMLDSFVFVSDYNTIEFGGFNSLVEANIIRFDASIGPFDFMNFIAFSNLITCANLDFQFSYVYGNMIAFENLQVAGNLFWDVAIVEGIMDFASLESCDNMYFQSWGTYTRPILSALTAVNGSLLIYNAESDISLPLLDVVGNLSIHAAEDFWLVDTLHMPELDTVHSDLYLSWTNISDLTFLEELNYLGGNVNLNNNQILTDCSIRAICNILDVSPQNVQLLNNGPGCNTHEEIIAMCTSSYVTGSVFADLDCDGILNNNDVLIPYVTLFNQNGDPVGSSHHDGQYFVGLEENSSTTIIAGAIPGFVSSEPHSFTTTTEDVVYSDYNFGLCADPSVHNLSVVAWCMQPPRPGFTNDIKIVVQNLSPNADLADVLFDFSEMPGASVSIPNGGFVDANTISWSAISVAPMQSYEIVFSMYLDPSVALGTIYVSKAHVFLMPGLLTDLDITNNDYSFSSTVVGSYDPNDKAVNIPSVNIAALSADDVIALDYTIRFQNTGTAPADFVRVEDFIEDDLDLSTFQMLYASHPYQITFDEDRRLEWLFEDIMLPDSSSDLAGSQGYIHFRINTKSNIQLTDAFENQCSIYFDFNEPIITNTARTIMFECPEELMITTEGTTCEGQSIAALATYGWDDYNWTANNVQSGTGLGISIDNAAAGDYQLICEASTEYCHSEYEYVFTIQAIPAAPVITQSNNVLSASGDGVFHWVFNEEELIETGSSIAMSSSGDYGVYVVENGCSSEQTNGYFTFTNVNELNKPSSFIISPNPVRNGQLLEFSSLPLEATALVITNLMGERIEEINISSNRLRISSEHMSSGVYFVSIQTADHIILETVKLVVE